MANDVEITLDSNLMNELHTLPEVQTKAQEAANAIAEKARGFAPVDSGAYASGIKVEKTNKKDSGVWVVRATDQKSAWIEFGNGHQPAQFVLRSAVQAAGYAFVKRKG